MKYGTETNTVVIDDNGSTVTVETPYKDGVAVKPQIRETRIRVRVRNRQEEMREYIRFTDEQSRYMEQGISKEALGFDYKYTQHGRDNGYYFLEFCWREKI